MKAAGSIRGRLILALAGVSVFTLVVVGLVFYLFLGTYVIDRQKEQLLNQAVVVAEQVQGLSDSAPLGLAGGKILAALLRSDLRVLPAGAGIAVFRGAEVVAKAGVVPTKTENLARLRTEGRATGGDGTGSRGGQIRRRWGRRADGCSAGGCSRTTLDRDPGPGGRHPR